MPGATIASAWGGLIGESAHHWRRRNRMVLLVIGGAVLVGAVVAVAGQTRRSGEILALAAVWGPFATGFLTMSGIVAADLESGLVAMWFQKPGTLVRPYLVRYALNQALLAGFALLVAAVAATIGVASDVFTVGRALRLPLVATAMVLIPAAVVFAVSAWGIRRDGSVALIIVIGSLTLAAGLAFDAGLVARVVRAVAFPLDAIEVLSGASPITQVPGRALAVVAGQILAWSVVGAAGLRYTEERLRRGG